MFNQNHFRSFILCVALISCARRLRTFAAHAWRGLKNGRSALVSIALVMSAMLVAGCANLTTIGRTSSLTTPKAVHLDVYQRLLIANKIGTYCTEPSPDAMAAFASALNAGFSKGDVSVDIGKVLSQEATSIGLRTQSITLMRDALYRMCEAYANGQLSQAEVMTLLSRSQDLTAVILAIEQLTGPVVAKQGSISSSLSITEQNDSAATLVTLNTTVTATVSIMDEVFGTSVEVTTTDSATVTAMMVKLPVDIKKTITSTVTTTAKITSESNDTRIATKSDTLLAGEEGISRLISDESTKVIAGAVVSLVNNVVNKSYVLDYCMAIASYNLTTSVIRGTVLDKIFEQGGACNRVIQDAGMADTKRVLGNIIDYNPDSSTDCIVAWRDQGGEDNQKQLDNWRAQNLVGIDHVDFMGNKTMGQSRLKAIHDLNIECK